MRPSASRSQALSDVAIARMAGLLVRGLGALPAPFTAPLSSGVGRVAQLLLPGHSRMVRRRLEIARERPASNQDVRRCYATLFVLAADTARLFRTDEDPRRGLVLPQASRQVLKGAFSEGRGVVFVTAHLGAWERMAALLRRDGFPVATVARESTNPGFNALVAAMRSSREVRCLNRGPLVGARIVHELRAGGAVGFLVDLSSRVASQSATLFDRAQPVAVGPFAIALAQRSAVVVGTPCPPQGGAPSTLEITRISTADLDPQSVAVLHRRTTEELRRRIAAWPEAWLGLHVPTPLL